MLTGVGVLYVLLALWSLAQGASAVLGPFSLPAAILSSPYFLDYFHWLMVHMAVIGILLVLLGRLVTNRRRQAITACCALGLELHYLYLDLRTSTWGSGLYADPRSLVLVAIDACVVAALAHVCYRGRRAWRDHPVAITSGRS